MCLPLSKQHELLPLVYSAVHVAHRIPFRTRYSVAQSWPNVESSPLLPSNALLMYAPLRHFVDLDIDWLALHHDSRPTWRNGQCPSSMIVFISTVNSNSPVSRIPICRQWRRDLRSLLSSFARAERISAKVQVVCCCMTPPILLECPRI